MTGPVFEIVTYRVEKADRADAERTAALERVRTLPGFIAWTPFTGAGDAGERVDLVVWATLEDARAAARIVGGEAEFAAFRETIGDLVTIGHYEATSGGVQAVASGTGVEVGRFRLKAGVGEKDMRAAHAAMVARHLVRQPGWRGQHLLKFGDGMFVDLAFADSRERAVEICAGWQGNADCDAFLSMIEPESMEFGSVV